MSNWVPVGGDAEHYLNIDALLRLYIGTENRKAAIYGIDGMNREYALARFDTHGEAVAALEALVSAS